ncbi:MAG: Hpt domain-containing protein [Oscillospiraceae bacterium]|nr:Hpt domain-containing protein [Oscillospiraceae bacterium]
MDARIEKLHDWGCDTNAAMDRMLGDEDFYLECLCSIPADKNFELLTAALERQDVQTAFECAHTLKGVLANLGLTPMYQKTIEIVEPLRAGDSRALLGKAAALTEMKNHLAEILQKN